MKIFLTYASEDINTAEQVYFALVANNHTVFFDRASLPPGVDYNSQIRQAILDSDLLVFLISENSIRESSYALTELAFAQKKWPHPAETVIPVMVRKTDLERIPNYLKAVTILEPRGYVAAEISDEITKIAAGKTHRATMWRALSKYWLTIVSVGIAALVIAVAMRGYELVEERDLAPNDRVAVLDAKVQALEIKAARAEAAYQNLKDNFSRLQQEKRNDLNVTLVWELAKLFKDLPVEPHRSEIESVLQDPHLTVEDRVARVTMLVLEEQAREIERQLQFIKSNPSSTTSDIESTKLKRMIDKRNQMFDHFRLIVDKYNTTAKGIIDSMSR